MQLLHILRINYRKNTTNFRLFSKDLSTRIIESHGIMIPTFIMGEFTTLIWTQNPSLQIK